MKHIESMKQGMDHIVRRGYEAYREYETENKSYREEGR